MGSAMSHSVAPSPPPPIQTYPGGEAQPPKEEGESKKSDKVDYLNLPCPVPYEDIQREIMFSLKPELFEGMRFDFNKPLSPKFSITHSVFMGSVEVPNTPDVIKVPNANYEFGANFLDPKLMLVGRVSHEGRVMGRVKCDLTDNLILKINGQLTHEPHYSQGMLQLDYKGSDYRTQFSIGNNAIYSANYIQSITPNLALGGEVIWLGHQRRSAFGVAARYNSDKMVATAQLANSGQLALTYVRKVSEKVSLATEFVYNSMSKDVLATVGYDYFFRMARLRGKFDSNWCFGALLEERLSSGINFMLSAEIDHWKKDYKFGFGFSVGDF
ncbi:hypothetical protein AMTRI_Chr01g102760 [Amborella trichopoda]|uniref:Mitochondrial import receptor subunit TOM40-1 n=1 Tax=Amborella trichopoda TaxID=13333 RepID=W1NQ75_AMBTC|nr:mitochondrial import receptor subunit TOM40-1 [Amborella trichopoda]ERM97270.1 hypothetical protein AMTR_s00119p00124540 [Amborella trichopoda]|eukprot:XP_006829854.1 mitochondrial import receptor subunit TOM40-1 [Amborella trichopoda]